MRLRVSFEVFPPAAGLDALTSTVERLSSVDPLFVSVTYGAGGSQRDRSFDAIGAVRNAAEVPVAGHLTCVGQAADEVDAVIDRYEQLGVSTIVALRGDPPGGVDAPYAPHPDGYQRTADLVGAIAERGTFGVAVSAYPERHPHSPTDDHDLDVLAEKVDAGADLAITQMFFDNDAFLRYRDRVTGRGIAVTIAPGIFPIHSFEAVSRFAGRCGATIPASVAARFDGVEDGSERARGLAAELAAEQIAELRRHGVDHAHLYTLNRADLALAVCERLETTALTEAA